MDWLASFDSGFKYHDFLKQYATSVHLDRWKANYDLIQLSANQKEIIARFTRKMNVICLSGTWCGDCANQCPIFERIVEVVPKELVQLHYIDRDAASSELREAMRINGGHRVPAVVFVSEDGFEVARYGEKTLAKYRDEVSKLDGVSCSLGMPGKNDTELRQAVIDEWIGQFERAQLILRLSARLRQKYGD